MCACVRAQTGCRGREQYPVWVKGRIRGQVVVHGVDMSGWWRHDIGVDRFNLQRKGSEDIASCNLIQLLDLKTAKCGTTSY